MPGGSIPTNLLLLGPGSSTLTNSTWRFYPDQSFNCCGGQFYPDQPHLVVSPDQLFFLCPLVLPWPIPPGYSILTNSLFLYLDSHPTSFSFFASSGFTPSSVLLVVPSDQFFANLVRQTYPDQLGYILLFIVRADLASGRDFHLAVERAELLDFEFYCIFERIGARAEWSQARHLG